MPTPRLSVLITAKDYGRFLPQAIASVRRQRLPRAAWELIVVDDGSTDDTAAVCRQYGDDVRYIYQDNAGQAAALNRGLHEARGEFITLLDADDWFYDDKLERLLARFESNPDIGMVHHRLDVVNEHGERLHTGPFRRRLDEGWLREQLIRYGGTWNAIVSAATSALAFRRRELEAVLPIPEAEFRTAADGYLATQMALRASIGAIHESLGAYRLHGHNHWAPATLTVDWIRGRYLRPMAVVSDLVRARVPEQAAQVRLTDDRVYMEYQCLAEKLEGNWRGAANSFRVFLGAVARDRRINFFNKLWRALAVFSMLLLSFPLYARLKHWYARSQPAYAVRTKLLPTSPCVR